MDQVRAVGTDLTAQWIDSNSVAFRHGTAADRLAMQSLTSAPDAPKMLIVVHVSSTSSGGRPMTQTSGTFCSRFHDSRRWLFALAALLVAAPWGKPPVVADTKRAADRPAEDNISPTELAEKIQDTMRRYDPIEYTVEYEERQNTNALFPKKDPVWIDGKGKYTYRSDGKRWFIDENGYTFNSGQPDVIPEKRASGFDGERLFVYHANPPQIVWHEEDRARERFRPANVLWNSGKSTEWLLAILQKPGAKVLRRIEIGKRPCVVVETEWTDDWDKPGGRKRCQATISLEQSYLPLKVVWERAGAVEAQSEMRGLKETDGGLWYPLMIRITRPESTPFSQQRTERFTTFRERGPAGVPFDDAEFRYGSTIGLDVVDRKLGAAWHEDPWWQDLAPWMKETFNWPRGTAGDGLSDESYKALEAEWKRLTRLQAGNARIGGVICLAARDPEEAIQAVQVVKVEAIPLFRMLFSNTPGGWTVMEDRQRSGGADAESPGRYEIPALRKGEYRVTFSRAGYASIEREVLLTADDSRVNNLDVTLVTGDTIAGRVVDATGLAVKGAMVRALHRHVEPNPPNWTTTAHVPHRPIGVGDDGRFRFDDLYEGSYALQVTAAGFETLTVKAVKPGTIDLKVVLQKSGDKE
jgi:hypothetical protein